MKIMLNWLYCPQFPTSYCSLHKTKLHTILTMYEIGNIACIAAICCMLNGDTRLRHGGKQQINKNLKKISHRQGWAFHPFWPKKNKVENITQCSYTPPQMVSLQGLLWQGQRQGHAEARSSASLQGLLCGTYWQLNEIGSVGWDKTELGQQRRSAL